MSFTGNSAILAGASFLRARFLRARFFALDIFIKEAIMSAFPFIAWAFSIAASFIIYVIVGSQIEKSGEQRLGATGNLFTCNPEATEKKGG
jgi:hypothetical protein